MGLSCLCFDCRHEDDDFVSDKEIEEIVNDCVRASGIAPPSKEVVGEFNRFLRYDNVWWMQGVRRAVQRGNHPNIAVHRDHIIGTTKAEIRLSKEFWNWMDGRVHRAFLLAISRAVGRHLDFTLGYKWNVATSCQVGRDIRDMTYSIRRSAGVHR